MYQGSNFDLMYSQYFIGLLRIKTADLVKESTQVSIVTGGGGGGGGGGG